MRATSLRPPRARPRQRDGDEVVEVYLTFPKLPGAPIRALRGFTRVHIAAGEMAHVHLALNPRDLSYVSDAGNPMISAGTYNLSVGGGQPDTSAAMAEASFTIAGEAKLPE